MNDTDPGSHPSSSRTISSGVAASSSSYWQLPASVRRVFAGFPLKTFPSNELPERCPQNRKANILHIFSNNADASKNIPSFNPACLRWQAYISFSEVQFDTFSANNHASPSGVLPFLTLGRSTSASRLPQIIPANRIPKWICSQQGAKETAVCMRHEAYTSLVDYGIRNAWLFALYLDNWNSQAVAKRLYIDPSSTNPLIRTVLFRQLQAAALDEILKNSSSVREDELYLEAGKAFAALSSLLGEDIHFSGNAKPGLFDASIFAYTRPLLDSAIGWQNSRLTDLLRNWENLVRHSQRLSRTYFNG